MIKNLCFFNTTPFWGGGEKWQLEMANAFKRGDFKVWVCASIGSELSKRSEKSGFKVFEMKLSKLSILNPLKYVKIKQFLKEQSIDAIIINTSKDLKIAGIAAKWAGVKKIIYCRGSSIPVKNSFSNRYLFHKVVTDVIVNSKSTKKDLLINNEQLVPEYKIKLLYHGISTDVPWRKGRALKKTDEKLVIGGLGRLSFEKGFDRLIDVANILKSKGLNFKVLIGGAGKEAESLKNKVKMLNLENEVFFEGFITDVNLFYDKIDVFVLPSRWEGFGYVTAEALLREIPVIAFNICANPELITHNETGFLVPDNDTEAMAEKIIMLSKDPKLRQEMGKKGSAFVQQHFDEDLINQQLVNIVTADSEYK